MSWARTAGAVVHAEADTKLTNRVKHDIGLPREVLRSINRTKAEKAVSAKAPARSQELRLGLHVKAGDTRERGSSLLAQQADSASLALEQHTRRAALKRAEQR